MDFKSFKMTEFLLTLAAMVLGYLISSGVFAEGSMYAQIAAVVSTGLAAAGYSYGRSMVKASNAQAITDSPKAKK